jgi:hypothetical protein
MAAPSVGAQIVDPELFRVLVEMETRKAQRMRYVVSLVCLGIDEAARPAVPASELAQRVAPSIRATDAISARNGDSISMLLVDAEDTNLPTIMDRLTPGLAGIPWSAGGACFPKTAATADELLKQAETMMARAKVDGGRRFYLPS